jgi:prepilin-type processing-associated H-X9-DG protein/prepilin-type N-terminal cleavage/methylation domain-containing protein
MGDPQRGADFKETRMVKKLGFTLNELLVVIAVIACLAAILFPIFARTVENAHQATCASNLKQLALAVVQYTQDNDGRLPCGELNPFSLSNVPPALFAVQGWAGQVFPYVKSTGAFACPEDATVATTGTVGGKSVTFTPVSYAFNWNLSTAVPYGGSEAGHDPTTIVSKLTTPAKTVMLFEVRGDTAYLSGGEEPFTGQSTTISWYSNTNDDTSGVSGTPPALPEFATGSIDTAYQPGANRSAGSTARHLTGANYAFADGHVKWVLPGDISGGRNNPNATSAGYMDGSYACGVAEGTQFTGSGAHAYAFSAT